MPAFRLEIGAGVARVTLDRPPANALDDGSMVELCALAGRLESPDVRAVVLTGTGRFFSAGLDLFDLLTYPDDRALAFANAFDDAMARWFALERPAVAAINGHAIAGGAVLAAAADFRLVADGPLKMGLSEILVGVPFPTSALEIVRSSCAGPHLGELLYRGQSYGPADAAARRLADEVVPAADLLDRATALAAELGGHRVEALLPTKRRLRAEPLARMRAARAGGLDPAWQQWRTPETRAAMEAFRSRAVGRKG